MIALLLTAFAIPQDKQPEVAPTKYAMEKADLMSAYNQLVEIRKQEATTIQMNNILWSIRYFEALEKALTEAEAKEAEPEEGK